MRRGKDGAAVLVGQDAGLKGIDVAGRLDDLGLVHPDEGAEDGQVLGGIGALQGLDGLACHLGQSRASQPCFLAMRLAMRIMLRRMRTVNSTSGALSRMYSCGLV